MMFGGILNVVLDPIFIFVFHLDVAGAAIATALSNAASVVFFVIQYIRLKKKTAVSLNPQYFSFRFARSIFSVGWHQLWPRHWATPSNMVMVHLASGYGDIPVAAYGVVKRIDLLPLNVSMGLCQGFMPLVGYKLCSQRLPPDAESLHFLLEGCFSDIRLFYRQLCRLCTADPEPIHSGETNQHAGCILSADRLPGGAANQHQFSHQLYFAGHGERGPISYPYFLPPGASQHPATHCDESDFPSVRDDLDAAGGGDHYAADIFWYVFSYFPRIESRKKQSY